MVNLNPVYNNMIYQFEIKQLKCLAADNRLMITVTNILLAIRACPVRK